MTSDIDKQAAKAILDSLIGEPWKSIGKRKMKRRMK